jgi:hypothetical protein
VSAVLNTFVRVAAKYDGTKITETIFYFIYPMVDKYEKFSCSTRNINEKYTFSSLTTDQAISCEILIPSTSNINFS